MSGAVAGQGGGVPGSVSSPVLRADGEGIWELSRRLILRSQRSWRKRRSFGGPREMSWFKASLRHACAFLQFPTRARIQLCPSRALGPLRAGDTHTFSLQPSNYTSPGP